MTEGEGHEQSRRELGLKNGSPNMRAQCAVTFQMPWQFCPKILPKTCLWKPPLCNMDLLTLSPPVMTCKGLFMSY